MLMHVKAAACRTLRPSEWHRKLPLVTIRFARVLFLGDSMGGTGPLLFDDMATAVQVSVPQVFLLIAGHFGTPSLRTKFAQPCDFLQLTQLARALPCRV